MTERTCPECHEKFWDNPQIPYLICPHCGAKLNEYSSEDVDEGIFEKSINPS